MGTGQTLLTIGAMILLGSVILTTNRSLSETNTVLLNSNIGLEEVSLATSVIEEAEGKAFDHNTDTTAVTSTSQLTPASQLGPESGDTSAASFDDFDDFNGYRQQVTIDSIPYVIYTRVCYVSSSNPSGPASTSPTWNKRMDVWVWSAFAPDTVKMSTVYSYWNF